MAKKRTKKDKIRSQKRRKKTVKKIKKKSSSVKSTTTTNYKQQVAKETQNLFAYPLKLIKQDLVKTALVTIIVLIILTLLAFYR